jgi:hypothetical protein
MPDRRELDKIVFEVLGLTEKEQLEGGCQLFRFMIV